ncbi:farnesyl-diphosphate synthase [Hoeflea marina]|uniref:Probable farnesyl diphosphate synthase n=1 Tax=Hoeflea marina TaxID=274592 RepID=A0A317PKE8_9HYPH|nr:farnesyl diphosphate synthase [Hoeflea marina]PWV98207.1 farnesyl-diphosphate synthase [Hoeflea marina]
MTRTDSSAFAERLARAADQVGALLTQLLSDEPRQHEQTRPTRLLAAMRHGVLGGGKRLRPFLVVETAALFGGNPQSALHVAAALECVHCYSLVHDDLPAMDDDDLRRGQPTVHIAFDEASAVLAGDALLTLAFDVLSDEACMLPAEVRIGLVQRLARAAGIGGMVGGQALDLAAATDAPDEAGMMLMQAMKTGALLRFACEGGALAAGAGEKDVARMSRFGEIIGLAFQLADDLLDVTSDLATLGKAAGKDAGRGKATYVSFNGEAAARRHLDSLVAEACALLEPFGKDGRILADAARYIADRSH